MKHLNKMETSKFFTLVPKDVIKSATTAVFVAVIAAFYSITTQAGFDLFAVEWLVVLKLVINTSVTAFTARLGEKLLTTSDGKLFGVIG